MPAFGGYTPFPRRFGSGAEPGTTGNTPLLKRVFQSISAARGSAYSQSLQSAVGVENMAIARAIAIDGWQRNQKMANEFDPTRCTAAGLMPRWERIFGIVPPYGATEPQRRAALSAAWLRLVTGNWVQAAIDALSTALGPLFVGLTFQTPSTALSYWPGGNALAGFPWFSTLMLVSVQLTIPNGYANPQDGSPNAKWWAATGGVATVLDPLLPAWCTFQFYILSITRNPGHIGFYCDEPNADLEILDS